MAAACDLRIASETAMFKTTFASAGRCGDPGGRYLPTQLVGAAKARELYFLDERIAAPQALAMGLVTRVAPDAELETATGALAPRFARGPALAWVAIRCNLTADATSTLEDMLVIEAAAKARVILSADANEPGKAFLEKREPRFRGYGTRRNTTRHVPAESLMTSDIMMDTLAAQRTAFLAEGPVSLATRKDRLRRLAALCIDNAARFADAMSQDFGHRSREQSMLTDLGSSVSAVKEQLAHAGEWMRPERRKVPFPLGLLGAKATVEYQPKGVVGVISPWNFPVYLAVSPIAGAFGAGNRVMAKTSEATPATTALFEELTPSYFDRAELAVFGGGPEAGRRFASLPFDHLIFTGAAAIGRHILHAAADNLTPVTLELGGKSPSLVGRSADIDKAADRIVVGKMLNAGQICIAPDYAFVPEEKEAAFVDGVRIAVNALYPALLANDDYTSVLSELHHVRLTGYLDDARAKGAEIIEINPGAEDFSTTNSNKMPLRLVLNATDEMAVMQEEIFGPILPVKRYGAIDEAIAYVNAHDRPLALYYFGEDAAERRRVLDRTISGGVTLDDVLFHIGMEDLPFGGVGPSGMGGYHGVEGFRTFSHAKAVYKQARIDVGKLGGMRPPYGRTTAASIARMMKL